MLQFQRNGAVLVWLEYEYLLLLWITLSHNSLPVWIVFIGAITQQLCLDSICFSSPATDDLTIRAVRLYKIVCLTHEEAPSK